MAMYNYGLDSFTHVEHLYNNTKPIRGSNIVPLGDRRRKWECIIKVSPHQYVLSDYGEHQQHATAAVIWTRNADGTDTVEFNNESGNYAHNSRYSFLERCMPYDMRFTVESGKQYVRYDGNRYYLPKEQNKPVAFISAKQNPVSDYRHSTVWTLTSDVHPVPVTRVRVNKEAKAPYKKAIDEYLHWSWTMAPILEGTMSWETDGKVLREAAYMGHGEFCDMLEDEQHEKRTTMLHAFLVQLSRTLGNRSWAQEAYVPLTSDPKKFRSKFNSWVNHMGGFNDQFEELRGGK